MLSVLCSMLSVLYSMLSDLCSMLSVLCFMLLFFVLCYLFFILCYLIFVLFNEFFVLCYLLFISFLLSVLTNYRRFNSKHKQDHKFTALSRIFTFYHSLVNSSQNCFFLFLTSSNFPHLKLYYN